MVKYSCPWCGSKKMFKAKPYLWDCENCNSEWIIFHMGKIE